MLGSVAQRRASSECPCQDCGFRQVPMEATNVGLTPKGLHPIPLGRETRPLRNKARSHLPTEGGARAED